MACGSPRSISTGSNRACAPLACSQRCSCWPKPQKWRYSRSPRASTPQGRPASSAGRSIQRSTKRSAWSGAWPSPAVLATKNTGWCWRSWPGSSWSSGATRAGRPPDSSRRAVSQARASAAPVWLAQVTRATGPGAPGAPGTRAVACGACWRSRWRRHCHRHRPIQASSKAAAWARRWGGVWVRASMGVLRPAGRAGRCSGSPARRGAQGWGARSRARAGPRPRPGGGPRRGPAPSGRWPRHRPTWHWGAAR